MSRLFAVPLLALAACATAGHRPGAPAAAADPACANHTGMQEMAPAAAVGTKAFDHRPKAGELAICPVSGETFVVGADAKILEHGGRRYVVCCDDCAPEFEKNPSAYVTP